MARAIVLSHAGVAAGGGPFGAVVVKDGAIIGEGRNNVVPGRDPTQHAEIVAIRDACAQLSTHDLSGATIYTSCEPCPMCLAAIWWARCAEVVYANDRVDAAAIGFDDAAIYDEVARPLDQRALPIRRLMAAEALTAFQAWTAKADKTPY